MVNKLKLTSAEKRWLQEIIRSTPEAQVLRRAQAILWASQGEPVAEVAQRLCVRRQTIYGWMGRFEARRGQPLVKRLADGARTGRPAEKQEAIEQLLDQVLDRDAREFGFVRAHWNAVMLCQHLEQITGSGVSQRLMQEQVRQRAYRYKRPRYEPGRRAPYWRQAKGGSSGV